MNRWVKGTSAVLVALALTAVMTVLIGKYLGEKKMLRHIDVPATAVALVNDAAHVARGRYLFNTRGCATCHGADGAGAVVIDTPPMLVVSPNITAGANSVTRGYTSTDWVRTLRHGVKPNRTPVMIMPSEDYSRLTDDDVAALIAYAQQLAPVAGRSAVVRLPVAVKVMYAFGKVRDAAEIIDHALPPPVPVAATVSVAHGAYVAQSCIGCHGMHLSGGRIPGAPYDWPAPANLTPGAGSVMQRYPSADLFMAMLRSGQRPDGSAISPVMPFPALREMSEVDVRALYAYLQTLEPRVEGGR